MHIGGGDKADMSRIKILHAADLHLDSPFEGLSSSKAALRRSEQRELLGRLASLAESEQVHLVLLSGDLLDSDNAFFETGEELARSLSRINVPVFISPGNHDYYSPHSPYARLKLSENVHVFSSGGMECVELSELSVRVFGAGFTDKYSAPMLDGFHVDRRADMLSILCIHGEVGARDSVYNAISETQLKDSGMDYAALGHIHKASGLKKTGSTWYSWPGCPEGRGFDETGEKTVNIVELDGDNCTLETRCIASRRYETMNVDLTGTEPLLAIHTQLPDETVRDIYRIILTGETETPPDISRLEGNLSEFFFELQIRDETRLRRSVWERAGDDTLRGLFLMKLKERFDNAHDEAERIHIEQAARWGLAALDNMEEIRRHEDK